ncbi:hypothetical protein [Oenococcus sp.]|uniref:hypothetical protein n=1 Tax=Oenococcus sp. TaxID=1979414 RepID=UPI0039E92E8B
MAITMYQSDRNYTSPSSDRSLYSGLLRDSSGILDRGGKFKVTMNGLVATIDTGQAIIQGALVEITEEETLTLPANAAGKICIVVDLTKTNTFVGTAGDNDYAPTINQIYLAAVTSALTQDDLNNGGFIYEFPIATFSTTASSATISNNTNLLPPGDSGWKNLALASGSKFVGSDPSVYFCRYRIINQIVYIMFSGINVTNSTNSNQCFVIPDEILLDYQFNAAGTSWTSGGRQVGVGIVMQNKSRGNVAYVNWNALAGADGTNINASFSYPLS